MVDFHFKKLLEIVTIHDAEASSASSSYRSDSEDGDTMVDQTKYLFKLRGKRILIIGGSSGIGYAVAEAAVEHGGDVVISSSKPNRVDEAVASLQKNYPSAALGISGYACNLSDEATLETNIVHLLEQVGKLDHIVFTAGDRQPVVPLSEATPQAIHAEMTIRYVAPTIIAKHASKYINPSFESSITLTAGVVTEKPIPGWSVVAGARQAILGLAKALAFDLKPVRVNVVTVGTLDTNTWNSVPKEAKKKAWEGYIARTTTGRIAQASDAAEAYLYCMKDMNVTGSVISSNGGILLT